jgi:peptidyl-prolyl cis-trans isomerase C
MLKRYYALGFMALAITAAAFFATPALSADDTVIAVVNGDKIMKKDVMQTLKKLPIPSKDADKAFPMVVDQMINEKLIDDATKAAKVEDSAEYKTQLDQLKSQLAKQIYVDKYLHDKITEKAVKDEYSKFKKESEGREEIHAKHLLVKSEEEAKQAIKDLDDGAKFEDLVKQRSADASTAAKGGDLGWFTEDEMVPEFSKAAFALKPGTYSKEPVHSPFGYHVIYVMDKRAAPVPPLNDQVSEAIKKKLSQDAVRELIESLRIKAQIKMYDQNGKPFDYGHPKEAPAKDKEGSADKPAKSDDAAAADKPSDDKAASDKAPDDKPAKDADKADKSDKSDKDGDGDSDLTK